MRLKVIFLTLFLSVVAFMVAVHAGTLTCTVSSTCSSGVVIFRISSSTNAHAELPSQSNYANLICCSGVTNVSSSCTSTFAVVLKLSSTTNAHVEQNTQSTFTSQACISVASGGTSTVGYQSTNCTGFDTTVASMVSATNSHVGDANAYTLKICATASAPASVTCNVSTTTIAFGALNSGSITTASPSVSSSVTCSGDLGCSITLNDAGNGSNPGLSTSSPAYLIPSPNASYSATTTLAAGTEGYGAQATTTAAGSGALLGLSGLYNFSGNIVGGLTTTTQTLASSSASSSAREVILTLKTAISSTTQTASYADTLTLSCTGN